MTTATQTLTDFLLARIAEDEAREVATHRAEFVEGLPEDRYVEAALAHDRLLWTQGVRLQSRVHALGWALASQPPLFWLLRPLVLHRAAIYSDHPDYREEWRP